MAVPQNGGRMQLNKQEITALKNLIAYSYKDEEKHYEEDGRPKHHIFNSILVLNNALKTQNVVSY